MRIVVLKNLNSYACKHYLLSPLEQTLLEADEFQKNSCQH